MAEWDRKGPLHLWLQQVFKHKKQFGSKDRKFYRDAIYALFRLGDWGSKLNTETRMALGLWRQFPERTEFQDYLKSSGIVQGNLLSFEDYCRDVKEPYEPYQNFESYLQPEAEMSELNEWFGSVAPVWIGANPSRLAELSDFLLKKGIEARKDRGAFELQAGSQLNEAVEKGLCRIQDLSSRLSIDEHLHPGAELIWDACCGAGGKSLRLCEAYPNATLYISDSRPAIVNNAENRFRLLGYPAPFSAVCNLNKKVSEMVFANGAIIKKAVFDMVVCDVPCSGSGTWRRTPENLSEFNTKQIEEYASLQRKIVGNSLPFLKPGGTLVYITCSVFSAENRVNAEIIAAENGLKLKESGVIGGLKLNADYLYRAVLKKP